MTNGRIVSLAECESRSNASKTRTVPNSSTANATATQVTVFQLTDGMVVPRSGLS